VLLISHNMNDVFAVADSIAVLYLGQLVAQVPASSVTTSQVVELITTGQGGGHGVTERAADVVPDASGQSGAPISGEGTAR
jgi:D-xylose transport system ATP-binding protein